MPTLRPPQPAIETVAELSISGNLLCLKFAAKNEDFRQLARELRFRWNQTEWQRERKITSQTGSAEDRLIECAYKLLAAAFIVAVPDGIDTERVLSGDYADEHTRWIYSGRGGKCAGWFLIEWAYGEEFYHKARALPGSRYSKPWVAVPPEYFEEVADFAALYDFRFTASGQKLMDEARGKRLAMVRVELRPRVVKEALAIMPPPAASGSVAVEFLDAD